jgi:hypothetical protein
MENDNQLKPPVSSPYTSRVSTSSQSGSNKIIMGIILVLFVIGLVNAILNPSPNHSSVLTMVVAPEEAAPTSHSLSPQATTTVDTSNWKTYTSSQYGFEFKYPAEAFVNEDYTKAVSNFLVTQSDNENLFSVQVYPIQKEEDIKTWVDNFSSKISYSITPIKLNGYDAFYALSNSSVADSFYIIKNGNQIFLFDNAGIDPKEILSTFKFTN